MYELKSISSHFIPCRAEMGLARVLLCHPSPKLSSATHQLLVDASRVSKQRDRRICAPRDNPCRRLRETTRLAQATTRLNCHK